MAVGLMVTAVEKMDDARDAQVLPQSKSVGGTFNDKAPMDTKHDQAEDVEFSAKIQEVWSMIMESNLAKPLMDPPADVSPDEDEEDGGYTAVRERLEAGEFTTLDSFYEAHGTAIRFALLSEEQQSHARELDRFVVDSVRDVFPSIDEGMFDLQPEPSVNGRSGRSKARKPRAKKDAPGARRGKSRMVARGSKQDEKRGTRSATRRAPVRRKAEPADDEASRRRGRPRKTK
eukprot:CAMPEP_0170184908 /NCGR_PEP_ID=MMETSP0040_2-20121228/35045_1 /TAXON_ID=641309 /ORGANISM="Lotharella oceanica, Strain CCMP622" /LENGTH=230 /DNA_ID=CAMNT_0010431123 /DNA_START=54 /DNA_END=746 /DNA_ORIENTATION=-